MNALSNFITPQRLVSTGRAIYNQIQPRALNFGMRTRSGGGYRTPRRTPTRARLRTRANPRPTRGFVNSGHGISTQHDVSHVYRKKRMPRRKRKRWTRFIKKVDAVAERNLGSRTVVFNLTQSFTNNTSGLQVLGYAALYSAESTTASTMNDLAQIGAFENLNGAPTAADDATIWASTKIIFKSAILDLTFRNASSVESGGALVADSRGKMEVDVYELISPKQWDDIVNIHLTTIAPFVTADADTSVIKNAAGGTTVSLTKRGVTPWDLPLALSQWGIKILKKTKYFVPNQDTFTYQIRDPRRRMMTQVGMQRLASCNKPKWTRHVLFIAKLVPGLTVGVGDGLWTESIRIGTTRKYLYKIQGINDDRDVYAAL